MGIVDDLELSVRTSNVLRGEGVRTLSAFMALSKDRVMAMKGAGVRTWNEIKSVQTNIAPTAAEAEKAAWHQFRELLAQANAVMAVNPSFRVVVDGNGYAMAAATAWQEARTRGVPVPN